MRSYSASSLAGLALTFCACAGPQGLLPAERSPLVYESAPRSPLPDDVERSAGRLAALALANRPDNAAEMLDAIEAYDAAAEARGGQPSGLADNGLDLLYALNGSDGYLDHAQALLKDPDLDPVLRRRLERSIEEQPLHIAEKRLHEDRMYKIGTVFNRLSAPVVRFFMGGVLSVVEATRAALTSLLVVHQFPEATTQERQALVAYQEFVERYPDAPESEWVEEKIELYEGQLREQLHEKALAAAERAMEAGGPEATVAHLDRADRLIPDDKHARKLRERAETALQKRDALIQESLGARSVVGIPLDAEAAAEFEQLARAVLEAPPDDVARHARAWEDRHEAGPLWDEVRFLQAYWYLARDEEDEFFDAMKDIAELDPRRSTMARHASWAMRDPEQNPYAYYLAARRSDRGERIRWIWLGRFANGPPKRDLPRPVEWLLGLPGLASSIVSMPVRLAQYSGARAQFGGGVLLAGERYIAHFPEGNHAEEVHRELESLYAARKSWSQALEHHRGHMHPDPEKIAWYREEIAKRTLAAAERHPRVDVRASIYRSVMSEYSDTPQAETARRELQKLITTASPQHIRLSKDFLLEYPELWAPGALGLKKELLDGDKDNGEMADEGITLLGLTLVEISLVGKKPVVHKVPPERFTHFIAALELASYRRLVTDERELPDPDPQRDLFFERARLGLLDEPDMRPSARSDAVFLSTTEKYGKIRPVESLLPVEIVLKGGLEDFGLAAFPRVRLPGETADAFLYK